MNNIECDCGDTAEHYYNSEKYLIAICNHCNKTFAYSLMLKLDKLKSIDQKDYLRYKELETFK